VRRSPPSNWKTDLADTDWAALTAPTPSTSAHPTYMAMCPPASSLRRADRPALQHRPWSDKVAPGSPIGGQSGDKLITMIGLTVFAASPT
jgi:hypothetical protein